MASQKTYGALFVCLGNICRSPAAEGAFKHIAAERGVADRFRIDSAGTAAYHTGEPANATTRRVASRYGVQIDSRARQFQRTDFRNFDLILAMDRSNYNNLLAAAQNDAERAQIRLFREFDPEWRKNARPGELAPDTPDPYYGGVDGFIEVQEIALRTCPILLDYALEQAARRSGRL
jgi:protein-tyrosine phosphatase